MKFMLVIPVDLEVQTTKRSEIKAAMKRKLVELARNGASEFLRQAANTDGFLVRANEAIPGQDRKDTPVTAPAVTPAIES